MKHVTIYYRVQQKHHNNLEQKYQTDTVDKYSKDGFRLSLKDTLVIDNIDDMQRLSTR